MPGSNSHAEPACFTRSEPARTVEDSRRKRDSTGVIRPIECSQKWPTLKHGLPVVRRMTLAVDVSWRTPNIPVTFGTIFRGLGLLEPLVLYHIRNDQPIPKGSKVNTVKGRTSSDVWLTTRSILCEKRNATKGNEYRFHLDMDLDVTRQRTGGNIHELHTTPVDTLE